MKIKYYPDSYTTLTSKKLYIQFLKIVFEYPFGDAERIRAVKVCRKIWSGVSSPKALRFINAIQNDLYALEDEIKYLENEYPEYIL